VASKKRQHKALPSASSTPPSVQAAVAAKTQQLATPATAPLVPVTPQKGPTALAKEVPTASPCKVKKHGQNNKQQKRQKLKLKCSKKHGNRRGKKQGKKQKPQKGVKQLKQPTEKPQQDEVAKGLFIPAASPPKAGPPKRMPSSLALPEPAPLVRGGRIRLLSEEERERIRSMTAPSDMPLRERKQHCSALRRAIKQRDIPTGVLARWAAERGNHKQQHRPRQRQVIAG